MATPPRGARLAAALGALCLVLPAVARADEIELSIERGRVTLTATDAPLRDILAAWAEVGDTHFVDADKLTGPPVTLQLVDVAEADALRTLLRSATGYLAAPRPAGAPGASTFDRVVVLATRRAPRAATAASAAPTFPAPPAQTTPFFRTPGQSPAPQPRNPRMDVTPDEAAQLEQLQQLLQQPPVATTPFFQPNPAGRADAPAASPQTMPRPGMLVAPEPRTPPRRGGPAPVRPPTGDPFFPAPPPAPTR